MATSLDTFKKICGLLGSDAAGERAAAALKATAILREWGKTWADVRIDLQRPAEVREQPFYREPAQSYPDFWSGQTSRAKPPPEQPFTYRDGRPQETPAEANRRAKSAMDDALAEVARQARARREAILRERAAQAEADKAEREQSGPGETYWQVRDGIRRARESREASEAAYAATSPAQPGADMSEAELRDQVRYYLASAELGDIRIGSFAAKMLQEALAETHWIPVLREAVFDTLTKLWIKSARAAA